MKRRRERCEATGCYYSVVPLNPMSTFDPDRPSRVHDRVNGGMLKWHTGWASNYRQYARTDKVDGTVW
jgi:hypothetical protein